MIIESKVIAVIAGILGGIVTTFVAGSWIVATAIGEVNTNIAAQIGEVKTLIVSSENRILQKITSSNEKIRLEFKQDIKDLEIRTDEKIGLSDKIDKLHNIK